MLSYHVHEQVYRQLTFYMGKDAMKLITHATNLGKPIQENHDGNGEPLAIANHDNLIVVLNLLRIVHSNIQKSL